MRNIGKVWIFVFLFLLIGNLWAKDVDLDEISAKIQKLAPYARKRTVAIKVIIGQRVGFGSGAIISPDGLVLTCAHVSEISPNLTIITSDGRQYRVKRLGKNSLNDYSLLKIRAKRTFPFFKLGNSSKLKLLQWVVALGHPGGPYPDCKSSVSAGRIRGLHKRLPIQLGVKFYNDAIQTDVPIFAGNSGGPLIDLEGNLIGINGAIMLINDLAFSVPINQIKPKLPRLKKGFDVSGSRPGNIFQLFREMQENMHPEDVYKMLKNTRLGKIFRLFGGNIKLPKTPRPKLGIFVKEDNENRVQVISVKRNSIADIVGIRPFDRILEIDYEKVKSTRHLIGYIERLKRGDKAILLLLRGKKTNSCKELFLIAKHILVAVICNINFFIAVKNLKM